MITKPRRFGLLIGSMILFPIIYVFLYPGEMMMNTFFVLLLLIDWYFQKAKIYQSNLVTFIVSVIAGYGLASMIVMQVVFLFLI